MTDETTETQEATGASSGEGGHTGDDAGPVMELTAAQMFDTQMREMLAATLGENIPGSSDHNKPDYYDVFEWDPNPSTRDFYALALRNPYAFAVTFLPASTSWRNPPRIVDDAEVEGGSGFEDDVEEIVREVDLWDYGKRADKLAGIGDFGVLVLQFDDIENPNNFDQEVSGAENLVGLRPFSRLSIEKVTLGGPTSSRWGEPLKYKLDLSDENDQETDFETEGDDDNEEIWVHHSRVIHIPATEPLDDEIRAPPRQQPVYNNIIDIERALGSSGELAYRASAWGINVNIDKDYSLEEGGSELQEHLHRWQQGLEQVLRTHGADEVKSLGGEEIDPSNIIDPNIEAISSYLGIPQSVLKGNETGERATTQDLTEWYGQIQERREEYVTPRIVRALIDRLIKHNIISAPDQGQHSYSVEWDPLHEMSAQQIAETENQRAEVLERIAVELGLDRQQMVDYLRDGTLPNEVSTVDDDVAELEDAEASASEVASVEEMADEYGPAGGTVATDGGGDPDAD